MGALRLLQALHNAAQLGPSMENPTAAVTAAPRLPMGATSSSPGALRFLWQLTKPHHMLYPHTFFSSLSRDKVNFLFFPRNFPHPRQWTGPAVGHCWEPSRSLFLVQFSMTNPGTTSFWEWVTAAICSEDAK